MGVKGKNINNVKTQQKIKTKLPFQYVMNGILILVLVLVPLIVSAVIVISGIKSFKNSPAVSLVLIIIGSLMFLAFLVGAVFFTIYYYTDGTKRILKDKKYEEILRYNEFFIKCEKCGATLLVGTEICPKCKAVIISENEKKNEKNSKTEQLRTVMLKKYNCEMSKENIEIINSYFHSNYKTFEYVYATEDKIGLGGAVVTAKRNNMNKFIINFKRLIIISCFILFVVSVGLFVLGKFILK